VFPVPSLPYDDDCRKSIILPSTCSGRKRPFTAARKAEGRGGGGGFLVIFVVFGAVRAEFRGRPVSPPTTTTTSETRRFSYTVRDSVSHTRCRPAALLCHARTICKKKKNKTKSKSPQNLSKKFASVYIAVVAVENKRFS